MTTVVITQDIREYLPQFRETAADADFIFATDKTAQREHLPQAEIVLGWSEEIVPCCLEGPATPLRWIQHFAAGVDYLPLDLCAERGIAVTTASGVHGFPIAESVFAMLLAFARGLSQCIDNQRKGVWDTSVSSQLGEIHGGTLGILGTGSIGGEVARIAKAFGMTVLGMNTTGKRTANVDRGYAMAEWDQMLPQCDYVVNLLPLTPRTRGFIDAHKLAAMKPCAYYISAGRGATTDTQALVAALDKGAIAGAGLDVVDPEPLGEDSPLWGMANVIITPHISGLTPLYNERAVAIFLENLAHYRRHSVPCRNVVDWGMGY